MKFELFTTAVSKLQNIELPGERAQYKMAPPYRDTLIKQNENVNFLTKQAATMALFYPRKNDETHIALILRKTYKGVHSAQIGFPGGKAEVFDTSLQETALRETQEEIGVYSGDITVLKALTPLYIPPSNYQVSPYLGTIPYTPNFVPQETEVEAIIEVSLLELLNDTNVTTKKVKALNTVVKVPAFKLGGYIVWGATAMMLNEVKELLKSNI